MTPEAIREIYQIRDAFNASFAAAMDAPVSITKGNSHSSNAAKIAWEDRYQRLNYACVYAHIAPDALLPNRPLILRLGVNQGLGLEPPKRPQKVSAILPKLLRFELTLLPDELLSVIPWVISLWQAHEKGLPLETPPPCALHLKSLDELLRHGAWTQRAAFGLAGISQEPIQEPIYGNVSVPENIHV